MSSKMHAGLVAGGFGAALAIGLALSSHLSSMFAYLLSLGLLFAGLVALATGLLSAEIKSRWLRILIFLGGAFCLAGLGWGSPADFAKKFLAGAILLGVLVFAAVRIVRFNLLGWFLGVATATLGGSAVEMLSQPNGYCHTQGSIMLVVLAILLFGPILMWSRRNSDAARVQP